VSLNHGQSLSKFQNIRFVPKTRRQNFWKRMTISGSAWPWQTDYEEMCRKTVVRRLCKYLPFPTAFEDALATADPEEPEERDWRSMA
jgi:recombinational DNA repair protein RecT